MNSKLYIFDHPLIHDKLTRMRDKRTNSKDFRELLEEISLLMGYEVTRDFPTVEMEVETPTSTGMFRTMEHQVTIVPILRAGVGMLSGLQRLMPTARVGHIGLYRDKTTHNPVEYYCKLPQRIEDTTVIVVDPMLATGGSATAALQILKERGCSDIRLMCLVASPEGIQTVQAAHAEVPIYVSAVDKKLNEEAYIVPGLGDAGDRIFGTK